MKMSRSAHSFNSPAWLVAGLGNPGPQYAQTRHNAGFMVVDGLAERFGWRWREGRWHGLLAGGQAGGREIILLKPLTYMNRSGEAVAAAARWFGLNPGGIILVFDDMDLPLGKLRLRLQGGAGGHRGVASVIQALGDEAFCRVRIGIGRPAPGQDAAEYVLQPFTPAEREALAPALEAAREAILLAVAEGFEAAMQRFN